MSTPLGTSGYAISAGGPLLLTGVDGFVFTPLPKHGGFAPPLVIDSGSELVLDATDSFAGARLEIDGQVAGECAGAYAITLRPAVATQVTFDDQESLLTGLRRRRILFDSPRFLAEADRDCRHSGAGKLTATLRPPSAGGPWSGARRGRRRSPARSTGRVQGPRARRRSGPRSRRLPSSRENGFTSSPT